MIRWSPSTELANLHGAMDRVFEDFFGPGAGGNGSQQRQVMRTYALPLDVRETEKGYEIQAPVPGFKPEEVDITFADGVLRIQAEHVQETTREQAGYLRKEVAYGNFQRSLQLPGDIRDGDIKADFEDGVLTISVPKVPRALPKKIQVSRSQRKEVSGKTS